MIWLPFQALKLFFTRPRLFALGVFPGIVTFALSAVAVYGLWQWLLQSSSLWVSVPSMMVAFLLSWISIGKLSLLPVEDLIVDEVQKAIWGKVRFPAPPFSVRRLLREGLYSLCVAAVAVLVLLLALLPVLAPIQFVLIAWLSAYSFLSTIYGRAHPGFRERVRTFFRHPFSNFLLGAFLNILLFIPMVNVFLLGFSQILSALVHFRRLELSSAK